MFEPQWPNMQENDGDFLLTVTVNKGKQDGVPLGSEAPATGGLGAD